VISKKLRLGLGEKVSEGWLSGNNEPCSEFNKVEAGDDDPVHES